MPQFTWYTQPTPHSSYDYPPSPSSTTKSNCQQQPYHSNYSYNLYTTNQFSYTVPWDINFLFLITQLIFCSVCIIGVRRLFMCLMVWRCWRSFRAIFAIFCFIIAGSGTNFLCVRRCNTFHHILITVRICIFEVVLFMRPYQQVHQRSFSYS